MIFFVHLLAEVVERVTIAVITNYKHKYADYHDSFKNDIKHVVETLRFDNIETNNGHETAGL